MFEPYLKIIPHRRSLCGMDKKGRGRHRLLLPFLCAKEKGDRGRLAETGDGSVSPVSSSLSGVYRGNGFDLLKMPGKIG